MDLGGIWVGGVCGSGKGDGFGPFGNGNGLKGSWVWKGRCVGDRDGSGLRWAGEGVGLGKGDGLGNEMGGESLR